MGIASDVVIMAADAGGEEWLDRNLGYDRWCQQERLRYVKLRRGLMERGLGIIGKVQRMGYEVFADAKISGIPDEVMESASNYLKYKPWMLNVMAGACSSELMVSGDPKQVDALKRFADACLAVGTKPCAVTVLTSKPAEMVAREFGGRTPIEQVLEYVWMLLEAGFTDVVCSPQEVSAIRGESAFAGLALNTPGVRLPGSGIRDQARIATPAGALKAGADRLVIGQDLTNLAKGTLGQNFAQIAAHLEEERVLSC